jgi:hypothetical protein
MLIRGVVDDQVHDHPQAPVVGFVEQIGEVAETAELGLDAVVVGDVVAVVAVGGRVDRVEPDGGGAEALEVVEPRDQSRQVADAVAVGVLERPDVEAVDRALLIPTVGHQMAWHGYVIPQQCPSDPRRLPVRHRRKVLCARQGSVRVSDP